ncbi:putative uncharacterized protein [Xanthomonas citri pv. mangiferaeindicae LMG 941]|nr:putative uncharacterized protein [Xanthomonas citri pv. mangiferaeindicae LMG 941]
MYRVRWTAIRSAHASIGGLLVNGTQRQALQQDQHRPRAPQILRQRAAWLIVLTA